MPKGAQGRKPPKAEMAVQQDLTRRLRAALTECPLELVEMGATLQAEEEQVLAALRRLGKKKRGRLRSGVVDGLNCWWWERPSGPGRPGRPLTYHSPEPCGSTAAGRRPPSQLRRLDPRLRLRRLGRRHHRLPVYDTVRRLPGGRPAKGPVDRPRRLDVCSRPEPGTSWKC